MKAARPVKVRVIPNGVDAEKFHPRWPARRCSSELGLTPGAPVAGIVAALRPEKNHELFLQAAALVRRQLPEARFLIVGDGPRRPALEIAGRRVVARPRRSASSAAAATCPRSCRSLDVLVLTSHMEANPVSDPGGHGRARNRWSPRGLAR